MLLSLLNLANQHNEIYLYHLSSQYVLNTYAKHWVGIEFTNLQVISVPVELTILRSVPLGYLEKHYSIIPSKTRNNTIMLLSILFGMIHAVHLALPNLANKNVGCPVTHEFQEKKIFFSIGMFKILYGKYLKSYLFLKLITMFLISYFIWLP